MYEVLYKQEGKKKYVSSLHQDKLWAALEIPPNSSLGYQMCNHSTRITHGWKLIKIVCLWWTLLPNQVHQIKPKIYYNNFTTSNAGVKFKSHWVILWVPIVEYLNHGWTFYWILMTSGEHTYKENKVTVWSYGWEAIWLCTRYSFV